MFGKKKEAAPLKNQPRSQDESATMPKRSFSFFKTKEKKEVRDAKKAKSRFRITRLLMSVLGGRLLGEKWVLGYSGLIVFIFFLMLASIGNSYIAQRKVSRILKLKKEVKSLRDEYISGKSQLVYYTKMSEVARKLQGRGIKQPTKPAFKLISSKKEGEE